MKNIVAKSLVGIIILWILASVLIPFITEEFVENYYLITYLIFGFLCIVLLILLIIERRKEIKEERKNDISNY